MKLFLEQLSVFFLFLSNSAAYHEEWRCRRTVAQSTRQGIWTFFLLLCSAFRNYGV